MLMLRDREVQSLFDGYEYDKHHDTNNKPRGVSHMTSST